jgi:hypothetical protein
VSSHGGSREGAPHRADDLVRFLYEHLPGHHDHAPASFYESVVPAPVMLKGVVIVVVVPAIALDRYSLGGIGDVDTGKAASG